MKTRNTDDLAERAARLWLGWNPTDDDPVGCPANVADAVTEWAEAIAAEHNLEYPQDRIKAKP